MLEHSGKADNLGSTMRTDRSGSRDEVAARRGRRARIQDAAAAFQSGLSDGQTPHHNISDRRRAASRRQNLPPGYGVAMDERVVEYPWVFARLTTVGKMLDAGSTFNHDFLLERPPLRGADLTIMTLAPEKRCYWYNGYSYVFGDLRDTMFADQRLTPSPAFRRSSISA